MVTMETACNVLNGLKPTLLMVTVQMIMTGLNILYKLAAHDGMNLRIMVAYRFLFSTAFMVPLAFFLERKKRPKLTWTVLFQAFLGGLFGGSLGQNLYIESLVLTSATCAAAMSNLTPAITFIVAVCLRLEVLSWKTQPGKAKVIGTLISIGGAMLFAFYKGPEIILWRTNVILLHSTDHHATQKSDGGNLVLGIILALFSCVSSSLWLIVQAKAAASYPCPQSFTALVDVMGSIQSLLFALCTERDWSQWKLGWNIKLLTVSYAGVLGSGLMFIFIAVCVRMRGPLFVSIFSPLLLILVAISGSLLLDEKLHLGNLLGAVLIICGLYGVLWGKSTETKKLNQLMPEQNVGEHQDLSNPSSVEKVGGSGRDKVTEEKGETRDCEKERIQGDDLC